MAGTLHMYLNKSFKTDPYILAIQRYGGYRIYFFIQNMEIDHRVFTHRRTSWHAVCLKSSAVRASDTLALNSYITTKWHSAIKMIRKYPLLKRTTVWELKGFIYRILTSSYSDSSRHQSAVSCYDDHLVPEKTRDFKYEAIIDVWLINNKCIPRHAVPY